MKKKITDNNLAIWKIIGKQDLSEKVSVEENAIT